MLSEDKRIKDGTYTYHWDARNRLASMSAGSGSVAAFVYDSFGRRVSKSVQGRVAPVSNHAEGAPDPLHLGTGEGSKHFTRRPFHNRRIFNSV